MLMPDNDEARRFLTVLGNHLTFQVYADSDQADVRPEIIHADSRNLDRVLDRLAELNRRGAGIFVTVNTTDGQGRKKENITSVRAIWADFDHTPLENVRRFGLEPHIEVVSSIDAKRHFYWLVEGFPLEQCEPALDRFQAVLLSDASVCDLSRVLRVPGFFHQKESPIMTRLAALRTDKPRYAFGECMAALDAADGGAKPEAAPEAREAFQPPATMNGREWAYVEATLQGCIEQMMSASEGGKWTALRDIAYRLGGLAWAGLDREDVAAALVEPIRPRCRSVTHACKTARDAFDAGAKKPLPIPDRPLPLERPTPPSPASGCEQVQATNSGGDKPMLILPGNGQTITQCAETIFEALGACGGFYECGSEVVQPMEIDGRIVLEPVSPEAFRSVPEAHFLVVARRAGANGEEVLKPTVMSREAAAGVLACIPAKAKLPQVRGLSGCALITHDGRVITRGLDRATGILVTRGDRPPDVPLDEAITAIKELVKDFAFPSPGDRARCIASKLTPAFQLGGILPKCPIKINEADLSQTGKDYDQAIDAALYGETQRTVTQKKGGVGSFDESFGSALAGGSPFISLCNWRGSIDSPNLEAFMTSEGAFPVRLPHRPERMVYRERHIVSISSNAAEMTKDLANRSYIVRLRKQPQGYRFAQYPEGDLLAHVRANQPYYLGCIFAVVRAWMVDGRPQSEESRHDFRLWVRTLDWILQHIFQETPLLDGHAAAKERLSNPDRSFVRALAVAVVATGGQGQAWNASALAELAEANAIPIPGLNGWDETQAPRRVGGVLGRVLGGEDSATVDEYELQVERRSLRRPDGNGFYPGKVYRLLRLTAPERTNLSETQLTTAATVEEKISLGNTGIFKSFPSSTVVNCGAPNEAQTCLDNRSIARPHPPEQEVIDLDDL